MDADWDPSFPHFTVVKTAKRNEEALIGVMNVSKSKQPDGTADCSVTASSIASSFRVHFVFFPLDHGGLRIVWFFPRNFSDF